MNKPKPVLNIAHKQAVGVMGAFAHSRLGNVLRPSSKPGSTGVHLSPINSQNSDLHRLEK